MAHRRGYRHPFTIDGQTVWLDSKTEAIALDRLINVFGFSKKWIRPQFGIKHAGKQYTPDFELSVDDFGYTSRALLEVKQYRKDFTKNIAERMCAAGYHYHTKYLYLYAVKTDKWYKILSPKVLRECRPPLPGKIPIDQLSTPRRFVSRNYYGRRYYQSFTDRFFSIFRSY